MAVARQRRQRCDGCSQLVEVLSVRFVEDAAGKVHRLVRCLACWAERGRRRQEQEAGAR